MHYLIALFATPMASETGWSLTFVQGGFSLALVVMGLASYRVGNWIDLHGGRVAMIVGSWCGAVGCALLATMQHELQFLLAWVMLGLGMRLALYDAAFAAMAYVGGASARHGISLITLMGGLASTVFWPVGQQLAAALGWRGALGCYALLLAVGSLLHLAIPRTRSAATGAAASVGAPAAATVPAPIAGARFLYGYIATGIIVLQTGMAAHFIELLRGRGWDSGVAVALASLLGIGQLAGRAVVILYGRNIHAVRLNLLPGSLQCACFVLYLSVGQATWGAAAFAFLYGAGNGIATITRGAMPLVLFDPAQYGRIVGRILKPAFALAAAAPVVLALVIERAGHQVAAQGILLLAASVLAASMVLCWRLPRAPAAPRAG